MIIGTAGHIDHGKTALIHRLTGIDTDRLAEEKRRGMTIELGFAHLDAPGLGRVGIIDVPGHERFIHTMVAGATGIDLVLLVVAADDGVMPQTREHLAIVTLLGITRGVVALNKVDRVDAARVQAVTREIHALLDDTPLRDSPIVAVSAQTGEGVDALRQAVLETLGAIRARRSDGFFRLAVDRVFVMPGFGPVITGTVASGEVHKDDRLTLLPEGQTVRVRGLQTHNCDVESVAAGARCAINLAGIDKEALHRGMMLGDPRLQHAAHTVDTELRWVPQSDRIPKNHQRVRLHSGTSEGFARLLWLEGEAPPAGQAGLAQLRLQQAMPLLYGDHFIVRDETAQHTLGGGVVLDPFAARRGARRPERIQCLQQLRILDPQQSLEAWLKARGAEGWYLPALAEQLAEPPEKLVARLAPRTDIWQVEVGGTTWLALTQSLEALLPQLRTGLEAWLQAHPRITAMPMATLQAQVCPRLDREVFRRLAERLAERGEVEITAEGLRPVGHQQHFTAAEQALAGRIEATLAFRGQTPPKLEALGRAVGKSGPELIRFLGELERAGRVVQVARGVYLTRHDLDAWQQQARALLQRQGSMTLAQFRDNIGCGRELAMQVLEYLDRSGLTRREGNARVLREPVQHEHQDMNNRP